MHFKSVITYSKFIPNSFATPSCLEAWKAIVSSTWVPFTKLSNRKSTTIFPNKRKKPGQNDKRGATLPLKNA